MQHPHQHPQRMCYTSPMPSNPIFTNGPSHYTFPQPYQEVPNGRMHHHPASLQYPPPAPQHLAMPPIMSASAPPSALSSPALPSEVYFSPYAHEYTSYFSVDSAEPPSVRRSTPLVHRRSRVVMACTYCRRRSVVCRVVG
jgi:hypothetical protein